MIEKQQTNFLLISHIKKQVSLKRQLFLYHILYNNVITILNEEN